MTVAGLQGEGTFESPYLIYSETDLELYNTANQGNTREAAKCIKIMNDISFGTYTNATKSSSHLINCYTYLDGNGFTFKDYSYSSSASGSIYVFSNTCAKNLTIRDFKLASTAGSTYNDYYISSFNISDPIPLVNNNFPMTFDNIHFENCIYTSQFNGNAIGFNSTVNNTGKLYFKNCKIISSNNSGNSYRRAGIAYHSYNSTIVPEKSETFIEDCIIDGGLFHSGFFAGRGAGFIRNVYVKNSKILGGSSVGSIVGINDGTSALDLKNCIAENCDLKGLYAHGISGAVVKTTALHCGFSGILEGSIYIFGFSRSNSTSSFFTDCYAKGKCRYTGENETYPNSGFSESGTILRCYSSLDGYISPLFTGIGGNSVRDSFYLGRELIVDNKINLTKTPAIYDITAPVNAITNCYSLDTLRCYRG